MPRPWTDEERRRADEEEEQHYWELEEARRAEEERAIARETAIEVMENWFFEQFEDPQNETPRDSDNQSFFYPWGGPFEAADVLRGNFGSEFEESWIDAAVERLERDGTVEWAPTSSGDFYEPPDEEIAQAPLTATALERLDTLEAIVAELRPPKGRMGHNQPPGEVGLPPYDEAEASQVNRTIDKVRIALADPVPNADRLAAAAGEFEGLGTRIGAWLGRKGDLAVDEFIKSSIKAATWAKAAAAFLAAAEILHRLAMVIHAAH